MLKTRGYDELRFSLGLRNIGNGRQDVQNELNQARLLILGKFFLFFFIFFKKKKRLLGIKNHA